MRALASMTLLLACAACGGSIATEAGPQGDASAEVGAPDSQPVVDATVDAPPIVDAPLTLDVPAVVDAPSDDTSVADAAADGGAGDAPTEQDAPAEASPKPCVPSTTCGTQDCGWAPDGCGHAMYCGTCSAPEYCGGGGFDLCGACGALSCGGCNDGGACVPTTCAAQNVSCGPAPDGCGGVLQCGPCDGGGQCTPRTCADLGFDCGYAGDGCGGLLNCGNCTAPETCGGAGDPDVCGVPDAGEACCSPSTCAMQGLECGAAGDGCGHLILGEIHAPPAAEAAAEAMTFAAWAPIFLKRHYQGKKPSAVNDARTIVETHILQHVGSLALDALRQHVADELEQTWRTGGYRETKRDRLIAPCENKKTLNNRKVVLIRMLKYAVACADETGLRSMPCAIKLAKVDTQRAPEFYEPDVYKRIVSAAGKMADPRALAIVLLGGDVGMREGEMLAARRTCVNYRTGKITPERSVYQKSAKERIEDEVKGGLAIALTMTKRLAKALKRLSDDPAYGGADGYLLHDGDGKPLTQKALKVIVKRVEKAAGLPVTGRVHIYRHTYVSHLAMAGVPARQIMALARHKHLSTTLRYMHLARDGQEHAVSALERLRRAG